MATLILTAVGNAVGGPIGGAIGSIIGQQVDARLFAPKSRHGPRLGELSVQTSSYGTAIPKIFGTMRVAGTVIWSTDFQESRATRGGSKGRPKTTEYSYSASFAVALSGRPIRMVRRIWADGKLLRGASGDFKSDTGYRLYLGGEDQPVDPLIGAAEGAGQAPAFRGLAYAVFEDFQLADYGNRIPSLSFEVEAEAEPVALGAIAAELTGGLVTTGVTPSLTGYAASGDSIRSAIETVADLLSVSLSDTGTSLILSAPSEAAATVTAVETGARRGSDTGARTEFARRAAESVAGEVTIAYYDVGRDFQTGLQRATRGTSRATERLALPAALSAEAARALAERRLASLWAGRTTARVALGWRRSNVRPGTLLSLDGERGLWKVERWTIDRMVVRLELTRAHEGRIPEELEAGGGRPIGHPDLLHGPTSLSLLDLPLDRGSADRPSLLLAASGAEAGWRRAALMASHDGGATWEEMGPTATPALMGTATTALASAGSALIDLRSSVEVELLSDAMWLEGRSDEALVNGANLAAVGEELVQFGSVQPLGTRRFRLSRLLRGRRGTEWAAIQHVAGERFVLIEPPSLLAIEPPLGRLGAEVRLMASGLGDTAPVEIARIVCGEAMRPPSPVHLAVERAANGDIAIRWVRRSRAGWAWLSGSDTPLAEEGEAYRLALSSTPASPVQGVQRIVTVSAPFFLYTAGEQAADGLTGELTVDVSQLGTFAPSRETRLLIPSQS